MKIYTKTGDDGSTGLIGGQRTRKDDPRIDGFGTVDELNAAIGWAAVACEGELIAMLRLIQNELFVIGSHLASPDPSRPPSLPTLDTAMISRLEMQIDAAEAQLAPLKQFILPGGSESAARLHLARTVCRRAERLLVKLGTEHQIPATIITYLNRLSDWLFVQARWENHRRSVKDIPWEK